MYPKALETQDLAQSWANAKPVVKELNPFSFMDRISLYKTLIDQTNRDKKFGSDNAANPLWGLVYQLQWQHSSGRLNSVDSGDFIEPDSPWSFGNFTLSVIPYLGAIAAGLVDDIVVTSPQSECRFEYAYGHTQSDRTVPVQFKPALEDWKHVFELMQTPQNAGNDESLRIVMWRAHKTSLDVAADAIRKLSPKQYSAAEIEFLRGWCRMVDFLAAAAWRTDHDAIMEGGIDVLPARPLEMTDLDDALGQLPESVRDITRSVIDLANLSEGRFQRGLWLWQRMMRKRTSRDRADEILATALNDDAPAWERLKLIRHLF